MPWQPSKELFVEIKGLLLRFAIKKYKLEKEGYEAEEFMTDGMTKLWENFSQGKFIPQGDNQVRINEQFKAYALKVSHGTRIDKIRREYVKYEHVKESPYVNVPKNKHKKQILKKQLLKMKSIPESSFNEPIYLSVQAQNTLEKLDAILIVNDRVSQQDKDILAYKMIGYTYSEIAQKLNMKEQTVVSKLNRIRNMIMHSLKEEDV